MTRSLFLAAAIASAAAGWVTAHAQADGSLKWSFATQGLVFSSPAVAPDGTIYVGSESKRLWAINPDGTFKWRWPTTLVSTVDWFDATPAIADDGTVYAGNFDGRLYALRPNGSLKWAYDTASYIISSPAIGADGTIYFGAGDGSLHAVNPDGTGKWEFATGDWVDASPAVGADGTIYVGSWDASLYAVNPDGTLKWSVPTGEAIQSSPAIGPDGTIFIGSGDGRLYAVSPAGAVKWSFQTGDTVDGSPVVGPDGTVYFGSSDGQFYALESDGTPAWSAPYAVGQGVFGSAAIRADGSIIFGASDRRIHVLNANGSLKWTYPTGDSVDSSPTVTADGTILVGSYDNKLYALHGNGSALADTSWPKFRRDLKNRAQAPASAESEPPVIVTAPASLAVESGAPASFSVAATGTQPLAFQWLKDGVEIPGAQTFSFSIAQAGAADQAAYSVRVSNTFGVAISPAALLTVNPPLAPAVTLDPRPLTVGSGSRSSLWVAATGSEPLAYQWFKDGIPVPGATASFFEIESTQAADAGSYTVQVANAAGLVTSAAVELSVVAVSDARLVNLSTRAYATGDEATLIPGFVFSGSAPRQLLIRAAGPSLLDFGVTAYLPDPRLTVYSGAAALLSNDNWYLAGNAAEIAARAEAVGAFPFAPLASDAAALLSLSPGSYTVQVSGSGGAGGVSLVEVYDVDAAGTAGDRLVNISTRAQIGAGDLVMIPGFVIDGTTARALLIRAVGPSLNAYGVEDFLTDPVLQLFDEGGVEIYRNAAWGDAPAPADLAAAATAVGAFDLELGSTDAAMLVVLMPGTYTAQASGANGAGGTVLVEVYEVP